MRDQATATRETDRRELAQSWRKQASRYDELARTARADRDPVLALELEAIASDYHVAATELELGASVLEQAAAELGIELHPSRPSA